MLLYRNTAGCIELCHLMSTWGPQHLNLWVIGNSFLTAICIPLPCESRGDQLLVHGTIITV